MVITGSIIGAGFASGQEINSFFYKYGNSGIIGLIISILLISIVIFKVFTIIKNKNINTYKEFLENIFNSNKSKYLNLANITNIVINIFLAISFFIMIAGFGAYFNQEYNLNSFIGSTILSIICFIIFMFNIEGLLKVNKLLIPILIIFMLIIGGMNINNVKLPNENINKVAINFWPAIVSGVIYASYNVILLIPTLITLKENVGRYKNIIIISILEAVVLFILAIIIYFLLLNIKVNTNSIEMPAVYVVRRYFNPIAKMAYEFIILVSILTTAIAEGISLLKNICKTNKSYKQVAIILCITSVLFSRIGFSNLINLLYPIFGILGFFKIFIILTRKSKLY